MNRRRVTWIGAAALVVAIVIGLAGRATFHEDTAPAENAAPAVGGPFTLIDHHGKQVTDADYRGKWLLVFFGYTFCPDVCPTTLQMVSQALDLMGDKAARIQPLFITVDPERDTPEVLAEYVSHFHPSMLGLTGSAAQIAAVAKGYRVYYAKSGDGADYLMDHTSLVYVIGPDGKYVAYFPYDADPADVAAALAKLI